ncbi:transposase [Kalymmatonema gypsitolerans NIES-4073]|nr:transposase [Scytonema sp. HK-05]BAY46603.1 transposase [Scytonema sp. HK-05]BAZ24494.1 transposase [Scytonema sp. NIES-4073]BAZ24501.1 transposase [Scytonema sp. NIES-4073]
MLVNEKEENKFAHPVKQSNQKVSRLTTIWVDGGNDYEPFMQWVMNFCRWIVQVVLRSQEAKGFVLLKKRWVVERTYGKADGMSPISSRL